MSVYDKKVADWYREQARQARELAEKLREAIARGAPQEEIKSLERRLELARYVGD
jgi:hypothetical protein